MSEAKHTQGKLDVTFIPGGGYGLESEDGFYMAELPVNFSDNDAKQQANANRLALCWNTHDQTVAALRKAVIALDLARSAIEPLTGAQIKLHRIPSDLDKRIDAASDESRAALAAVEGGK